MNNNFAFLWEKIRKIWPSCDITLADLRAPTTEVVLRYFTLILDEFGIDLNKYLQPIGNQLEDELSPALYADTQGLINASKVINAFIQGINIPSVDQFGPRDILNPDPHRNMFTFVAVLNFYYFADGSFCDLKKRMKEIDERHVKLLSLSKEYEKLVAEQNSRACLKSKGLNMLSQINDLKKFFKELQVEVKSMDSLSDNRQAVLNDAKRHLVRAHEEEIILKENIKELEQQLVQSPVALMSNHEHLKQKLVESELRLKDVQANFILRKETIETLEAMEKDHDARQSLLSQIVCKGKKIKDVEQNLAAMSQTLSLTSTQIEEMESQKSKLLYKASKYDEELTNIQLQWKINKSALMENSVQLNKEREAVHCELSNKLQGELETLEARESEYSDLKKKQFILNDYYEKSYSKLMEEEKDFTEKEVAEHEERVQLYRKK